MTHQLAVTTIGADQPGIVAAVAEVLRDRGGNVEDSAMTVLGGQFAIMLLVTTDDPADQLRQALEVATRDLGLRVTVVPVEEGHATTDPTHTLSVYGRDRPGILAAVARALAELGVNITDLSTRMLPPEDQPVYAMVLEISLPEGVPPERLELVLREVGERVGVDHTLRPLEPATY
ncbi:MAG TPA: ACT domain-containing protein [Nitriliruptorales bacterium]|nr:ACT domain-containing protein [Nitriliruptorales bacterium]